MKNGFWIGSGVILVALMIVYFIFVSGGRDAVERSKKRKDAAIKNLKSLRDDVKSNNFPTTNSQKNMTASVNNITASLTRLDKALVDSQSKVHFVKDDKNWKYTPADAVQYKSWYDKERNRMVQTLIDNNFILKEESDGSPIALVGEELISHYGDMGFKRWSSNTPTKEEILTAHQKLIIIGEIISSVVKSFGDKNIEAKPMIKKISFSDFMEKKPSSRMAKTQIHLSLEAPYSYLNKILSDLEANKLLRFEIVNQRMKKKNKAKNFSLYPNVIMDLTFKFRIFINTKKK